MDRLREFLERLKHEGWAQEDLLGLLHVLVGRRITLQDGTVLSSGLTWREAAGLLKRARWDREAVRELGLVPAALPPRNRQRYWYAAIAQADVGSAAAREAGDRLAAVLGKHGYSIGPAPGAGHGVAGP
jgi:hypothetical protein